MRAMSSPGLRFIIVGTGAALLLFALTFVFAALGLPGFAAGLLAYALTFAAAYLAQRSWTFGGAASHARALPRYFVLQAASALLSGLTTHLTIAGLGFSPLAAAAMTTLAASAVSYVVSSRWVFVGDGSIS